LNRNQEEGVNMYRDYVDQINNKNTTDNLFSTVVKNIGASIVSIDK